MSGLYFAFPALLAVLFSCLIVRGAAIALELTGLDDRRARFQARSAFTGTGFTTKEAEAVVDHHLRRKIISWLMLMGHVGIVAIIITATTSLVTSQGAHLSFTLIIMVAGVYAVYKIVTHERAMSRWENYIKYRLMKLPVFSKGEMQTLHHFGEACGVLRVFIKVGSSLAGSVLSEYKLAGDGSLVLGVERRGEWISMPGGGEKLEAGDSLVVYGPITKLKTLLNK